MTQPNIAEIKSMSKEDLATLNRKLSKKLAINIVGMLFVKIAAPKVAGNILTKLVITAAKRA